MSKRTERTPGEESFEAYLYSQELGDFEFEKEHLGKQKKPDYTLEVPGQMLFEVKDIGPEKDPKDGAYDGYRRIREKIDQARKKFREDDGIPCCLVLYDNGAADVNLEMPEIMLGAMEGDAGIRVPILDRAGVDELAPVFVDRGKMNRPGRPQNTTISAIISLTPPGVIVWENRFAKVTLPRHMFRGPFDQRWVVRDGVAQRIFAGSEVARDGVSDV